MSAKKLLKAATQLNPLTAAAMRFVDEHQAEQEKIKAKRIVQVLEFRIKDLKSKIEKNDEDIRHILSRLPLLMDSKSHIGSYLSSLILANSGRSAKSSIADFYINQITHFSPIEAAIVYSATGKVNPANDPEVAEEIDRLEQLKVEFSSQFEAMTNSLVSRGMLLPSRNALDPMLFDLLSENENA